MNPLAEESHNQSCFSGHDHKKCVNKALSTATQLCRVRGVQLTPIRHQVLELIWDSHKPLAPSQRAAHGLGKCFVRHTAPAPKRTRPSPAEITDHPRRS